MRVLQVHTRYRQAGGEDSVVDNERRLLIDSGHAVETHIERNPTGARAAATALVAAAWNPAAVRRTVEAAQMFEADVAHIHNTWFALAPSVVGALRHAGFPTVVTTHNYRMSCVNAQLYRDGAPCEDCVGRVPWRGVVRRCYRRSAFQSAAAATTVMIHRSRGTGVAEADVVIALTGFAAERLVAAGVSADRIVVKGNVVEDAGARLHLPSASHTVLYVGRLAEEKGVADLIEAWRRSPPKGFELVIVGDGPLRDSLEASLPPGIALVGQKKPAEVRNLLLGGRALIFPSRWFEGQPMILLEAMAAGLPIVYSELGAIPEVVGSGGWGFSAGRIASLADALGALDEGATVDRLGRLARGEFEERFAPDRAVTALEDVYRLARQRHRG